MILDGMLIFFLECLSDRYGFQNCSTSDLMNIEIMSNATRVLSLKCHELAFLMRDNRRDCHES